MRKSEGKSALFKFRLSEKQRAALDAAAAAAGVSPSEFARRKIFEGVLPPDSIPGPLAIADAPPQADAPRADAAADGTCRRCGVFLTFRRRAAGIEVCVTCDG